jgi:hypothetical protein
MKEVSQPNYVLLLLRPKNRNEFLFNTCKEYLGVNILSSALNCCTLSKFEYDSNLKVEDEGVFCLWIVIHSAQEFLSEQPNNKNQVQAFGQDLLIVDSDEQHTILYPIIHIIPTNIFLRSLYGNDPLNKKVPRSFQIMDNSIWNYLIPLYDFEGSKNEVVHWQDNFVAVIESVFRNYEKKLYNLKVAREFADLNARMTFESYLSDAHAKGVSPFIFHSESAIQRMIEKEFIGESNIIEKITNRKWRILLVDDKAIQGMSSEPEEKDKYSWNCKLVIIINLLGHFFKKYASGGKIACQEVIDGKIIFRVLDENLKLIEIKEGEKLDDITIMFEYAQSVEEAEKVLCKRSFDLILLDYYLEKDKKGSLSYGTNLLESVYTYVTSERHIMDISLLKQKDREAELNRFFNPQDVKYEELRKYIRKDGHEELASLFEKKDINILNKAKEKIKEDSKLGNGPVGRQFFLFISAYSSAVHERLLAEGLNQSEDYWNINVGACPTNTPQLFLYNFIKMMDKRLDDSGIIKLSSSEISKLVDRIFLPKEGDIKDSVRKRANDSYQEVLSLQYHYRKILKDVEIPFRKGDSVFDTKGSVLMTDFIQKKINLGGLLEHLTQLVHLTAFGTIRQWAEMWEEYIYFRAQFEKQLDDVTTKDFNNLCQNIENYILELKSQQQ